MFAIIQSISMNIFFVNFANEYAAISMVVISLAVH